MRPEVDDATMSDAGDAKGPAGPMTASEAEAEAADEAATEVAEAEVAQAVAASHEGDHSPGGGHEGAHDDAGHGGHEGHDEGEPLGPIDVKAWAASLVGVAAAVAVVGALGIAHGLI
jgi:hypothetical protein